jgi:hypothetical protein
MVKHQTVSDGQFASATEYLKDHVASTTNSGIELVWKDASASPTPFPIANAVTSVNWTDVDLTATTSATAKIAIIQLKLTPNTVGASGVCQFGVRKNGTTPTYYPLIRIDIEAPVAGGFETLVTPIGMDTGQVIEYILSMTEAVGWDVTLDIEVLAYYE